MIQLKNVSKAFGDRVLLKGVTWPIADGERVGLCGPNGAGKTTLLRMMAGLESPDTGEIIRPSALTVGYLPQDGLSHAGRTIFEEACLAFHDLLAIKDEMHTLEARLGDPAIPELEHDAMLARYSDLQDRFRLRDGYSIELRTASVLQGLGFTPADFDRQAETLSGGLQMRLALAKLLLGQPNLLLLDEPTNHLDLDARNWLESYLVEYPHAVILVSHDRFFLDAVVSRIADLTLGALTDYHGNYSDYLVEHEARLEALRRAKREQDEDVARIKMFIDRFRYQATKAAQVQSRIKLLEKVVPIEVPPERQTIHFSFPPCAKSGRMVVELKHARKAYGNLVVFTDLGLHIERGDRIALIGHNGAGKSTLMRMLAGEEAPDQGQRLEGHHVVTQYFAQDEAARLEPDLTVYDTLESGSSHAMVPLIRNILGGFLFSGDDVYKRVRVLSGGERTRLAVARMLLRASNTLLLDEPTNHLDLDSKEVLLDALRDYGGTLVFVSHDRYFVERLATKVIEVGDGEAIVYPGTYEEFLWHKSRGGASVEAQAAAASAQASSGSDRRRDGAGRAGRGNGARGSEDGRRTDVAARRPQDGASRHHERGRRGEAGEPPRDRAALEDRARSHARTATARTEPARTEARVRARAQARVQARIRALEDQIADREQAIRDIERAMAEAGFYDDRAASQPIIDRHQTLMWEVGDLMHQWEELQAVTDASGTAGSSEPPASDSPSH